jgi:hypothetical protein
MTMQLRAARDSLLARARNPHDVSVIIGAFARNRW